MEQQHNDQSDFFSRQPASFCRLSLFLSVLLPFFPPAMRQPIFRFSKIFECMECLRCPNSVFEDFPDYSQDTGPDSMSTIFSRLSPFLSKEEQARFSQMQNMMQMMKMYQMMQTMAPFMAQESGTNGTEDNPFSENFNPDYSGTEDFSTSNSDNRDFVSDSMNGTEAFSEHPNMEDSMAEPSSKDFSSATPSGSIDSLLSMLSPEQQQLYQNLKTVMASSINE